MLYSNKFKSNILCALIHRKLDKKESTKNSLIAGILRNGCKKYPTMREIFNKTESLYGAVFDVVVVKKAEEQILEFYFEFVDDDRREELLTEAASFLKEIVYNPLVSAEGFNQKYFDLEKENLKREIASKINNKSAYARSRLIEIMCAGEPFGVDGDGYLDELEKIDNKELFAHYRNILATSPIEIILMGNFKNPSIDFPTSSGKLELPEAAYKKKEVDFVVEYADVNQEKLFIGARLSPPANRRELYALILYNSILGGGSDSKLFKNIREKAGLCYYIYSAFYRFKSIMIIESGVEEKESERAVELILGEINKIAEGDFTDSDLEKARKSLISNFELMEDSQGRIIDFYVSQKIARDETSIPEIIKIIEEVSREDICAAAKSVYADTIYKLKPRGAKLVGENNKARAV